MNPVRIRIAISGFSFTLFLLLFCGPEKISSFLSQILPPLQFVPALLRILTDPAAGFVIGFVFIIAITLIFGRVYCSFLCPLGALQDMFIALSKKTGWLTTHAFQKPFNLLRYFMLGLVMVTAGLGSMSLVNLFDPYSIPGRIITQYALPLFLGLYNTAVDSMKYFNIYLFTKDTIPVALSILFVNTILFLLILILSLKYGRLYCNTFCPVGTLLGLISRVSLFKFTMNRTGCSNCAGCAAVCKAGCIDATNVSIDRSRCVGCFNCVAACPQSMVSYTSSLKNAEDVSWSPVRRSFLIGTLAAAGSALFAFNSGLRHFRRPAHASQVAPITPPGSVSLAHFTESCSACHLCVSACPTKVIAPSLLDYGIGGLLQPRMNYPDSFCEYECNLCGQICPTGAILPLSPDEKKITQIGEVDLLKDQCVVYADNKNCGACVEVCPTKTITFIDKDNILYPEIDTRYCIGCGACSKACPTNPKSIVVRTNTVHKKAEKQKSEELPAQPKNAVPENFPF